MAAQAPYNAHLRALLRAPKASAAHCLARAELVLGPPLSWATQLAMLLAALTALALGLGVRALLEGQWDPRWFENLGPLGFSLSMGALCLALLPAGLMHGAMLRTRREQSLLALLPGMPRNAELNQLLNARAVRRAMVCWLAAYGVVCLLPLEPSTARLMRAVCLGVLPVVPLLVQDWSRARMVSQRRALFIWVAVSFSIVAFFALQSQPQWTPVTCLLLSLGVTRLLYAWRYRQLARYPSAFPVGRLAPH